MNKSFTLICLLFVAGLFTGTQSKAQCNLSISATPQASICKATGSITVVVTGGTGNYNYKLTGGTFSTVTSSSVINGLAAGTYNLEVKDVTTGCLAYSNGIVVGGSYQDPRFTLSVTDITCLNGTDGSITVSNIQYGKAPFTYTIVAPSVAGVGTSNSSGSFTNLAPGIYYIRLTDSCGGIQTRNVTVTAFNWSIDSRTVTKFGCDSADATLTLKDSRGNFNTSGTIFNGFKYGVTRAAGDTTWFNNRSFRFYKGTLRSFTLLAKDVCGNIRTIGWTETTKPSVAAAATFSNQVCAGFTATITGQTNLTNPQYCLFNSSNVQLSCNSTGVFTGLAYGSYCINVRDNCYDTTITRCFTVAPPVANVAANITTSALTCNTFTASVTGQQNLTNPSYCIYNSSNVQLACNATGVFTNLAYGSYCIRIVDGCIDTTITRCFTQKKLVPAVAVNVSTSALGCSSFTATITGQQNINNGQYCIYDNNGNQIQCNSTGVFTGLAYGQYCINVINNVSCYDTTITRCFTVNRPVPAIGAAVTISNKVCAGFTATVAGQQNLNNPQYCIYNSSNVLISCNATGVFNNLSYGSYCIKVTNNAACYDTLIQRCFTVTQSQPAVAAAVTYTNKNCATFSASITGQANLNNAQYCIYDNANVLVSCNATGVFNNLAYGSYCIKITNDAACYDTVISRCFTLAPSNFNINISSTASCTIGSTNITASWTATTAPYTAIVYNPGGVQEANYSGNALSFTMNGLPGLPAGFKYKVVLTDACGKKDSVLVTPLSATLNKSVSANSKCPAGQWQNGSGDVVVFSQYSNGASSPKIVKKNGVAVSINYAINTGNNFTFSNMEPAEYIIEYTFASCSNKVYDTFNLKPYSFPSLAQSAIYQCNNNSFGVNSVVSGGLSPFSYEIMGSLPASPSIAAAPQNSPLFNINNGNNYSLVRLRAIDACGNATINDASILPLGNTVITASANCYYNNINLQVDTIPNATYTWYRKTSAVDSTLISTNQTYNIPYLLPSDTGLYVCKASVNSGCLSRVSYFNLTGNCNGFSTLAVNGVKLNGTIQQDQSQLQWETTAGFAADAFVVERSIDGSNFKSIGTAKASVNAATSKSVYYFTDAAPVAGKNFYRLRLVKAGKADAYSNIITLQLNSSSSISVIPNPVQDQFEVKFGKISQSATYQVSLRGSDGRLLMSQSVHISAGESKRFQRPANTPTGVYYLQTINLTTNEQNVSKLIFK